METVWPPKQSASTPIGDRGCRAWVSRVQPSTVRPTQAWMIMKAEPVDRIGDLRLTGLAFEAAEVLGQPHLEIHGGLERAGGQLHHLLPDEVARHSGGGDGGVVRSDRAAGHRVQVHLCHGQGADVAAGEEARVRKDFDEAGRAVHAHV